ncbi:MAG: carbohydrate ABC transporter permease [Clostridiales bacterium]|nr:carbohydrate ABC transporter permease [Clostridiales bacterium]
MKTISKRKKMTTFDIVNYIFMAFVCCIVLYPFLYLLKVSLSSMDSFNIPSLSIIPETIDFRSYAKVLENKFVVLGFRNTLLRVILGTPLTLIATVLAAYPLSKKHFPNRVFWTGILVFTMFFDGGLIPTYLLVKNLNLLDSVWALILPRFIMTFTLVIVRNYFMALPDSLEESAKIDGAGDFYILFFIVIPISAPIIATVTLWTIVDHWNAWFDSMIYIQTVQKQVLQVVLRRIVLENSSQIMDLTGAVSDEAPSNPENIKAAVVMVITIPIVTIYPFLQKYFVKGILVGSLKG